MARVVGFKRIPRGRGDLKISKKDCYKLGIEIAI